MPSRREFRTTSTPTDGRAPATRSRRVTRRAQSPDRLLVVGRPALLNGGPKSAVLNLMVVAFAHPGSVRTAAGLCNCLRSRPELVLPSPFKEGFDETKSQ